MGNAAGARNEGSWRRRSSRLARHRAVIRLAIGIVRRSDLVSPRFRIGGRRKSILHMQRRLAQTKRPLMACAIQAPRIRGAPLPSKSALSPLTRLGEVVVLPVVVEQVERLHLEVTHGLGGGARLREQ